MARFFRFTMSLFLMFSGSTVFAWADMGHKLVGGIAEEVMSQDAKDMVRGILGIVPLAVAAIFPDQVRDDARFGSKTDPNIPGSEIHDFSPFHFCEVPVGYTYGSNLRKVEKDCHSAMKYTLDLIKNPKMPRETKMIALRYLVHVVGDVHQPFHIGNGYDRGANACQVNTHTGVRVNLHAYWDENLVDFYRETLAVKGKSAPKYFGDVLKAIKAKRPEMFTEKSKLAAGAGSLVDWISESQNLREGLYPDKPEDVSKMVKGEEYKSRSYCVWFADQNKDRSPAPGSVLDESKIPTLDQDYLNKNLPLLEERVLLGGLRLASLLDQAAKEMKQNPENAKLDDTAQEGILRTIQDSLKNIFTF